MGFDYSVPLTAFGMAAILALMVRWVFRPSRPRTGRPDHGPGADLGMLTPVLSAAPRSRAVSSKTRLSEQGLRCSLSRIDAEHYDLLVFRTELDRAREILAITG